MAIDDPFRLISVGRASKMPLGYAQKARRYTAHPSIAAPADGLDEPSHPNLRRHPISPASKRTNRLLPVPDISSARDAWISLGLVAIGNLGHIALTLGFTKRMPGKSMCQSLRPPIAAGMRGPSMKAITSKRARLHVLLWSGLSTGLCSAPGHAAEASFNCSTASRPDEVAICADEALAAMDRIADAGYQYLRSHIGPSAANKLNLPIIKKRQRCGGDAACIKSVQEEAIEIFKRHGAPIDAPPGVSIGAPRKDAVEDRRSGASVPAADGAEQPRNSSSEQQKATDHDTAREPAVEAERQQRDAADAARRAAEEVQRKRLEELETAARSLQQLEARRHAELEAARQTITELRKQLERQKSQQRKFGAALLSAIAVLAVGVVFLVAKLRKRSPPATPFDRGLLRGARTPSENTPSADRDASSFTPKDDFVLEERHKLALTRLHEKGIFSRENDTPDERRGSGE